MAIAKTFIYYPDVGSKLKEKPNVTSAKFGDGYEQRASNGINTTAGTWSLTFTRQRSIGLAILTFLRGCKGVESFNWTNPFNETGVYVCRSWNPSPMKGGFIEITAEFEQVFEA